MQNLPELMVTDDLKWGKLVKTWATGMNYIGDRKDEDAPKQYRRPASFQDLVRQCGPDHANVGLMWTDGSPVSGKEAVGFMVFQQQAGTVTLKLPPKEMIEASEKAIAAGGRYPLPAFYRGAFQSKPDGAGGASHDLRPMTPKEQLDLHAMRIGDYVIRICH